MSNAAYEKARRLRIKQSMSPEAYKTYCRQQYQKRASYYRYRALLIGDKKRFVTLTSITYDQYKKLLTKQCIWCTVPNSNGVDRLDSDHGHTKDNCVPCCEKCNILLTNLPYEAKCLLSPGLKKMRQSGIFDRWQVPYRKYEVS